MPISNLSNGLRTGVCTSTNRPTTPYEGQHIYETDTDIEYVWSGTAWVVNYVSAASPTFTGTPLAPTATTGTNTTQLATTAFANAAGGLVYVTSTTVGTTVSTVAVASCFSTTYDNYKIIYSGGASSAVTVINLSLTGSTLAHYAVLNYQGYGGGAGSVLSNNRADWNHAGGGVASNPFMSVELLTPFLAKPTFMAAWYADGTNTGMITGVQTQTISFTGFTIAPAAGTFTGGTITVYGYRKA